MISAPLLLAAATAAEATICADRPSKANGTCTVPAGHWQLETSAADWVHARDGDIRSDTTSVGSSVVKLGLSHSSDIEVGFTPYVQIKTEDGGTHDRASGAGDAVVRYKQRLTRDGSAVQAGLIPFLKVPTASHEIGNGKAEGGLIAPITFSIAPRVTLTLGPELDLLADADGHGYHFGVTNLANLGISVTPRLSLSAELWNAVGFDPLGTTHQWSADASAAWLASKRVQLDAGANFGLSRDTPDIEIYGGASALF